MLKQRSYDIRRVEIAFENDLLDNQPLFIHGHVHTQGRSFHPVTSLSHGPRTTLFSLLPSHYYNAIAITKQVYIFHRSGSPILLRFLLNLKGVVCFIKVICFQGLKNSVWHNCTYLKLTTVQFTQYMYWFLYITSFSIYTLYRSFHDRPGRYFCFYTVFSFCVFLFLVYQWKIR